MDIFHRFVKTFPEMLDADEALRIWRCLHAPGPASGEGSLRFGVRELSVSMQAGGEVRLRWLAEAFERQPFQRSTAEQARSIAHCVFETLRDLEAAYLPLDRFDRLFDLAYPLAAAGAARPGFRLGYAIDLQEGEPPSFKWYAEPRATGAEGAAERFFAIAEAQGLLEPLRQADAAIRGRLPGVALRGFVTDLCVRDIPNLKVYYSVRGCDWKQLLTACAANTQGPGAAALERFHRLVLKGRTRVPPNTILLGVVLDPASDPGAHDLKWDVFLPQLHTGDGLLQARLVVLCEELGLDPGAYLRLWDVVIGPERPERFVNVHQYASLDLSARGEPKLGVHLRAPEHVTEHMPLRVRSRRLRAPDGQAKIATAVQRGLVALADAASAGYGEMTHRMVFPHGAGFRTTERMLQGCVFQRAVVCRVLASARSRYDVDEAGLAAELAFLASQQDQGSGGWKYFPDLAELPPDADSLAQVLLAFLELRDPRVEELFSRSLGCVEHLADPEGWIPTWLVEPGAPDPASMRQRQAIERWWGSGADPEVVANLGYALWRHDPVRFGPIVRRACEWLVTVQEQQGWWESSRYWGRTYGTWVACRLLAAVQPQELALVRAVQGWVEAQAEDGSWGSELETAFGLQVGVELCKSGFVARGSLRLGRGADWLCDRQNEDGAWAAVPWLRMDLKRARMQRGDARQQYLSHASSTLTTALCVQALLALMPERGGGLRGSR